MNAANPDRSERLQRFIDLMADGIERGTMEIIKQANVCAVNSIAAELRQAGYRIDCRMVMGLKGRAWIYRMHPRAAGDGVMIQQDLIAGICHAGS